MVAGFIDLTTVRALVSQNCEKSATAFAWDVSQYRLQSLDTKAKKEVWGAHDRLEVRGGHSRLLLMRGEGAIDNKAGDLRTTMMVGSMGVVEGSVGVPLVDDMLFVALFLV